MDLKGIQSDIAAVKVVEGIIIRCTCTTVVLELIVAKRDDSGSLKLAANRQSARLLRPNQ